jgi:GTPase SAR1 family protein
VSTNNNEKEYKPRYAQNAEEFVFLTDTGQEDYPIYLLPNREIIYKRRPEAEKFAVFHVKKVNLKEEAKPYQKDKLNAILVAFPNLPLREVVEAAVAVVGDTDVKIFSKSVAYEVYKGDYEEALGEFEAPYIYIRVDPHFSRYADSKQQFAITFTTLKRILSKLPENIRQYVEKRAYVDAEVVRKVGKVPFIKIKLPAPTPEFEKLFNDVVAWLTAPEVEEAEEAVEEVEEEEEIPEEVARKVEEVLVKPQELEIELATTAVSTAPTAPSKPELVKIFLLSMRLPSKYLVQSVEYNAGKVTIQEVRKWEGENAKLASRLETVRREAYTKISRVFAFVEEYGTWIAVTEQALEEAKKVSQFIVEELKKLGFDDTALSRYVVKAIPVYLAPEDARSVLSAAVSHLSEDIDELKKKIGEAEKEQSKSALKRLEKEKSYREALLTAFKNYLAQLG